MFILGVGRSGTSLVHAIFSQHSKIQLLPEVKALSHLIKINQFDAKHKSGSLMPYLLSLLSQENQQNKKFLYFGEKDPNGLRYWKKIHSLENNTVFLLCVRDPLDVSISKSFAAWSSKRPRFVNDMISRYQTFLSDELLVQAERCIPIYYEDLCEDPIGYLTEICSKLEIEFEEHVLKFYDYSETFMNDHDVSWKENLRLPILSSNSKKWVSNESNLMIAFFVGLYSKSATCSRYSSAYKRFVKADNSLLIKLTITFGRFVESCLEVVTFIIRQKAKIIGVT